MSKSIIAEGKTTNEAIEKGLKELNISKNMVDIKVLENEEKRSFFSILAPRIVKVQLTVKEEKNNNSEKKDKKEIELSVEEQEIAEKNIEKFLKEFLDKVQKDAKYSIEKTPTGLKVNINNENLGFLIGYRGETLNAMQTILSSIASRVSIEKIKIVLDIENYREKRVKSLEELAEKIAKTVYKNKKNVTLEPMTSYERKIIHGKLQNNKYVKTYSTGNEPYRKVVVTLKKD